MNPSFFASRNAPYYIYAPDYVQTAAGIRCLHYLCHALNELGEEAYIAPARRFNPKLRTPALTREIVLDHFRSGRSPIALYPEVITGNPFAAPVVAHWLLNKPGHLAGDTHFHPDDLVFYIQKWCLPEGMPGEMLMLPTVDQSIFNNENNPFDNARSGACYYAHKYLAFGGSVDPELARTAISLCLDIPRSPQELADILRRSEVLYCYEQSSMILEALACGCPVLIVPSPYWDQHGSDDREPKGAVRLATEPDALIKARKHLPEFAKVNADSLKQSWRHVRRFIEHTQLAAIEARTQANAGSVLPEATAALRALWQLPAGERSTALEEFTALTSRLPLTAGNLATGADAGLVDFSRWLIERTGELDAILAAAPEASPATIVASDSVPLAEDEEIELCLRLKTLAAADRFDEALPLMEILTQRGTRRWEIYNDLGACYAEQNRLDDATNVLIKGVELEPASTYCLRKLAAVYTLKQDYARILATSALILQREPNDQEIQLFVRDVLVASSPRLDNASWLDVDWQTRENALDTAQQREQDIRAVLATVRDRARLLLSSSPEANKPALPPNLRPGENEYHAWVHAHQLQESDLRYFQEHVGKLWKKHPLFEFILILRPGQEALLADTIDSLAGQFYDGWRLSIFASTPSPDPEFSAESAKVRWIEVAHEDTIADAVNQRILESPANWFGFFECGTQFPQQMLLVYGNYIATRPDWRLIYADDDTINAEGLLQSPRFKPDWNPDLLRSTDYIGSFVAEKSALLAAGGYAHQPSGERYDLALRLFDSQGEASIGHIPDVLSHIPHSVTQAAENEPATRSLQAHFDRSLLRAEVFPGLVAGKTRRIVYQHEAQPKVSIIIPTRNRLDLLGECIGNLLAQTRYPDWELLIVDNGSDDPDVATYYQALLTGLPGRVQIIDFPGDFNFAAMNNRAAQTAGGDYLLLLNNDTLALHDDWLDVMMSHAQRPEIGGVGARLLASDGKTLQHAGMVLGMHGTADSAFSGQPADDPKNIFVQVERNVSAVSGACLLVRKSLYLAVDGMDENAYGLANGDLDLCLKIRRQGYRILWTPYATLIHHGSATLAAVDEETKKQRASQLQHAAHQLAQRWLPELANDPAWNRNLSLSRNDAVAEHELAPGWNPDFRDRPRLLWLPLASPGQAEYRTFAPMRALHDNGLAQCAAICQPRAGQSDRAPTPVELARLAPDTLILHAPLDDVRCISLLHYKEINADILRVYSLDDLVTDIPTGSHVRQQLPANVMKERLRLGLAACDRLIVTTEPLADACRDLIGDIRLLPNTLEWKTWGGLQSARRRGAKLRVGWAGAQQHAGDLKFMLDVVKATHAEVDWVFLGMMPSGAQNYVSEFHDFVHNFADYPAKLASLDLDLAVAPLEIHPFNEAKSNLRLLEYGILGWPVICTDIHPYRTDKPPVTCLPNDAGQWIAAIRERIGEYDALAREGDALRDWVKQHYLLENNLERWLSALS